MEIVGFTNPGQLHFFSLSHLFSICELAVANPCGTRIYELQLPFIVLYYPEDLMFYSFSSSLALLLF